MSKLNQAWLSYTKNYVEIDFPYPVTQMSCHPKL